MHVSLSEIERLIDALPVTDQVRVLEFLVPRLASAVLNSQRNGSDSGKATSAAWAEFWLAGDRLAAAPTLPGKALTREVTESRR